MQHVITLTVTCIYVRATRVAKCAQHIVNKNSIHCSVQWAKFPAAIGVCLGDAL